MIVTRKKDRTSLKKYLEDKERIVIVGCSECAAVCQTGGSEQVKEMTEFLADKNVLATISIESPCDKRISSRDMRRIRDEVQEAEIIVALTCGSGVQALSEVTEKPVLAALDTTFLGMVERLGRFYERCSHCGHCILNDTAGLCPVTLCPKGLRNGPCEGMQGEKCEVNPDMECVWSRIYKLLEKRGELERFTLYHEPPDWNECHTPRQEIWERKDR